MTLRSRHVEIRVLPERVDRRQERIFLNELKQDLIFLRPAIVIDCSLTYEMDSNAVHLLLCCLELALKRNGDIRLSGVSPEARARLARAGVDRLFRIFPAASDAVESYHRHGRFAAPPAAVPRPVRAGMVQENAA